MGTASALERDFDQPPTLGLHNRDGVTVTILATLEVGVEGVAQGMGVVDELGSGWGRDGDSADLSVDQLKANVVGTIGRSFGCATRPVTLPLPA